MRLHVRAGTGCIITMLFGAIFGWVLFPSILKGQIKKEKTLSPKTDVRAMWEEIPFPLEMRVWLFNYTNPDEVAKGAKPIVKEVGPYFFEEWKTKVELKDDETNDTVSYRRKDTFMFDQSRSGEGLTGEEEITMPNIFLMAIPQTVLRTKPTILNIVAKALPTIFNNPATTFMKVKALDILFRGTYFNCSQKAFAPNTICKALRSEKTIKFMDDNQVQFSLFGLRNGTPDAKVVTVQRGINNVMDVGKVVAVDGKPRAEVWRDHCNHFQGTDGTVFPPFLTQHDRIETYSTDLFRAFKLTFDNKTKYNKIKTHRYVGGVGNLAEDPELKCLCPADDQCPKKGLMDVFKTGGGPVYISAPHYFECDPSLVEGVEGLKGNFDAHGLYLDFEPLSGTPMLAKQRIMFSINFMKIPIIPLMAELPDTIGPMIWIEETLALNDTFVGMVKSQLFTPIKIVKVVKWLMVLGGLAGTLSAVGYHVMVYSKAEDAVKKVSSSNVQPQVTNMTKPGSSEMVRIAE